MKLTYTEQLHTRSYTTHTARYGSYELTLEPRPRDDGGTDWDFDIHPIEYRKGSHGATGVMGTGTDMEDAEQKAIAFLDLLQKLYRP